MGFRSRLEAEPERLRDFLPAARMRLADGLHLAPNRTTAAVYLLGFSDEMLLKYAYFRLRGIQSSTLTSGILRPAIQRAAYLGVKATHENFHSVIFWAELIVSERRATNRPLSHQLERLLLWHVGRLYRNWWVNLRYRSREPDPLELKSVLEAVTWLDVNFIRLWR